jgi:hypothetical protein
MFMDGVYEPWTGHDGLDILDGMDLPNVRRALIGLAVMGAVGCTGPAGLGTGSPFGPQAPLPPGAPPGTPSGEGLCALPLPAEGCQDTPVLPFAPGE